MLEGGVPTTLIPDVKTRQKDGTYVGAAKEGGKEAKGMLVEVGSTSPSRPYSTRWDSPIFTFVSPGG